MEKASEVVYREFVEIKNYVNKAKSQKEIKTYIESKWITDKKSFLKIIKLLSY